MADPVPSPDTKTRFLHVHTFYPGSIETLYRSSPDLNNQSFDTQTRATLESGFSASHIFTPYLPAYGYDTRFILANNPYAQLRWLKEHNISLRQEEQTIYNITRLQIEYYQPDVLYFCDTIQFDSRFLRTLSHKPDLIMGWRGAGLSDQTDWSEYDVILSSLPILLEIAPELGAKNTAFFFPGYPTRINRRLEGIHERYDVLFAGSCFPNQHEKRIAFLSHAAESAVSPSGTYSCAFFLNGDTSALPSSMLAYTQPPRFGVEMHQTLKLGRIILDTPTSVHYQKGQQKIDIRGEDTINMRTFEALGGGCFFLTEHVEYLHRYFSPGYELETFRTRKELLDKIQYYLAHPQERREIALRGQEKCLTAYSMEVRAKAFDTIIRDHLERKGGQPQGTETAVHPSIRLDEFSAGEFTYDQVQALLRDSIDTFKRGNYALALQKASEAKAFRLPVMNVDFLRAACLMHLGRPADARVALQEELAAFPENDQAKRLLMR